jgi:VWFA-related protein
MNRSGIVTRIVIIAAVALAITVSAGQESEKSEDVKDIGLVERTAARLAQIDVTVSGPSDRIEGLGPEDFELRVAGEFIEGFLVDRVCRSTGRAEQKPSRKKEPAPEEVPAAAAPRPVPMTYVFYFDQPHLTMSGRVSALDIARELIRTLITEDAQAMIISSASEMEVTAPMTSDPEALLAALDELEDDKKQWDAYSELEDSRIEEIFTSMRDDIDLAIMAARRHQQEEIWQAERSLHRISMVMGRLAELDPPKAFLYFADTMRSNPGEHYLSFFGNALLAEKRASGGGDPKIQSMELRTEFSELSFNRLLNDASALGIRFYTVQAEGLVTPDVIARRPGSTSGGATPTGLQTADAANLVRVRHAQDTLASMALETGGRSFLNGIPPRKMIKRIQEDLSCVYLISFDPGKLPEDEPLPVRVSVTRPKVQVQSRGRLVIQSEEARQTSRLLAAFATSHDEDVDHPIQGSLVPVEYVDGKYSALLQVTVPGTQVANATWDVGASLVARGKVREDGSGRIRTATPGVRVVFERQVTVPPGRYELVAVAHETTTDQVFSRRFEGELPDPDDAPVTLVPVSVMQPVRAAFLREGILKTEGALAMADLDPVATDLPMALIGLVCRSRHNKNTLRVERQLAGEDWAPFPVLELEPAEERCAQYRDLVRPGQMTEGEFRYEVRVLEKDTETVSTVRNFAAVDPEG